MNRRMWSLIPRLGGTSAVSSADGVDETTVYDDISGHEVSQKAPETHRDRRRSFPLWLFRNVVLKALQTCRTRTCSAGVSYRGISVDIVLYIG